MDISQLKQLKHLHAPTALLSATLRTYQKAACDTDQVVIACPRGTSISIEFAQYNKFVAKGKCWALTQFYSLSLSVFLCLWRAFLGLFILNTSAISCFMFLLLVQMATA